MAVRIALNRVRIKQLTDAAIKALEQTAEEMHTDLIESQAMPFDKGTLQNTSTFIDRSDSENGKVRIVHDTPYARRLYFHPEYQFQTHENPNAGGEWWKDWISGSKKNFTKETFREKYRRSARL